MASKPWLDRKRLVWFMKFRPDPLGPWKRINLGRHEGRVTSANPRLPYEVEQKARELTDQEHRARVGISTAPQKPRDLRDYLESYIRSREIGGAASTAIHTTHAVERFIVFARGKGITTLNAVTRALCRDYLESRSSTLNPNSLKTERGYLMGAWSRAVEDEVLSANPWKGAKAPGKILTTAITFWTAEEITRIAAHCRKPWQADLVRFLAHTGLRVSTALCARWSWIDRTGRFLQIEGGPRVKTVYGHYLGVKARELLDRMREGSGGSPLLFPSGKENGGGPMAYESARSPISRAIRRSRVAPGTLQCLRHSYGRMLALTGVPVTVIQRQLGHTTLAMTLRYVAATDLDVARFVEDKGFDL